jgi:tetratricopeptide (TPR) repeat protein
VGSPELKLVDAPPTKPAEPRRGAALLLGLLVVVAFVAGTLGGAGRARQKIDVREQAQAALRLALERGSSDPEVQAALFELRRTLDWRPLESRTRIVYASLVLGLAMRLDDMQLAAFHARRAAELNPVTVSVVHAASLVLANTGEVEQALELTRSMFGYDPVRAAETLSQIEELVLGTSLERAIPETPQAWTAWAKRLRDTGRQDEALRWYERAHRRWPEHLPALTQVAGAAFTRKDWARLAELLPVEATLPDEPQAAYPLAWRAHLRWENGDRTGAVHDIEAALERAAYAGVRRLAGDLFEKLGEIERARGEWSRALHELRAAPGPSRTALLARLARLEQEHGRPAAALRHWEALLAIDPEHREAQRQRDDLSGFNR